MKYEEKTILLTNKPTCLSLNESSQAKPSQHSSQLALEWIYQVSNKSLDSLHFRMILIINYIKLY